MGKAQFSSNFKLNAKEEQKEYSQHKRKNRTIYTFYKNKDEKEKAEVRAKRGHPEPTDKVFHTPESIPKTFHVSKVIKESTAEKKSIVKPIEECVSLDLEKTQLKKLQKKGFIYLESFFNLSENEIFKILTIIGSLDPIKAERNSKFIYQALLGRNILKDSKVFPTNKYSHSCHKRIVNLGFTSWTDLAIYLLKLGDVERQFFIKKYIKLTTEKTQSLFLHRLCDVFEKDVLGDRYNPYTIDWLTVPFLTQSERRFFVMKGFLSPFQILEKFKGYKEAVFHLAAGLSSTETEGCLNIDKFRSFCYTLSNLKYFPTYSNENQLNPWMLRPFLASRPDHSAPSLITAGP